MEATKTILLHGWSDSSKSFEKIKKFLVAEKIGDVKTILYADYESREDNLTFNDVADGLNDEFIKNGFIESDGTKKCHLNVIVHSTGGLVIRHWIWCYYYRDGDRIKDCPVKRLIMLAPANFGSPLAHRGKSFLGSLVKGRWKVGDLLETGRQLLHGLELGSPFQWELAHHDLIIKKPYFNANQIQLTILVGIKDYNGIRGWINKPGTDGTVVIAGTSLDSAKLVLDFSKPEKTPMETGETVYMPYQWQIENPPKDFAFGILDGLDHGSIVEACGSTLPLNNIVLEALRTETAVDFRQIQKKLVDSTREVYEKSKKPKYQQFLLHAVDDFGVAIPDFTVEFFILKENRRNDGLVSDKRLSNDEQKYSEEAHKIITSEFHTHSVDASYRRYLVDVEEIVHLLQDAEKKVGGNVVLSMRIYVPKIDQGIVYDIRSLQNVVLYSLNGEISSEDRKHSPRFFYPNTTTLIELKVNRSNSYVTIGQDSRKH